MECPPGAPPCRRRQHPAAAAPTCRCSPQSGSLGGCEAATVHLRFGWQGPINRHRPMRACESSAPAAAAGGCTSCTCRRQSVGATHSQSPSRAACGRPWLQWESRACGAEGKVGKGMDRRARAAVVGGWPAGGRRVAASAAGADRHPGSCDPPSAGMITCACDPESRSGAKLEVGCGCTGGQATRRARSCNVCNVQTRRAACHALNPPLSMQGASVGVAPLTARHSCRSALQAQRNPCQLPERL